MSTQPVPAESGSHESGNGNRPVHTIRYGNVKCSIWQNPSENGPFHSVTTQRSWRDEAGEWHDSQSFNFKDLPSLAKAVSDCHSWIAWQERQQSRNAPKR